jgi:hypothetical protein
MGLKARVVPGRLPLRRLTTAVAAAAAVAGACTEVNESADVPFSLSMERQAAPGVVFGDSLRDTLGDAVQLRATAYNFEGEEIPGIPITFTSLDTTVNIVDGYVIGRALGDTAQIVASVDAGGEPLQTQADRSIVVTLKPDSVGEEDEAATYAIERVAARTYLSPVLDVEVWSRLDTPEPDTTIQAILVRYDVAPTGQPVLDPNNSTVAWLVEAGTTRRATSDTTGSAGTAGVRLQVAIECIRFQSAPEAPLCPEQPVPERFTVTARVTYKRGTPVRGSPVTFTVENPPLADF